MSAKRKLEQALSAVENALRAVRRAKDSAPDDENIRRAVRELHDAESFIGRAITEVRRLES